MEQAREEEKGVIVIPFDLTNMPARDFLEAIAVHKNSSEDQVDFWLEWGERSPDGMFMHWQVDGSLDSLRLWLQDTQAWLKEEQDDRPVPVAELELEKQDSVVFETAGKEKPHNFNAQRLIDLFSGWLRQGLGRDGVLYLFVDDAVGNEDFLKVIGQNSLPLYASWGFEIAKAAEHVDLGGKQVDVWRVSGNLHAFIKWLKLHILYFDKESILEQVSRGEAFPEGYVVSEDAVRHYVHKLQETGSALFETLEEEVVQAELINLWLRVEWSLKILSSDKSDTGLPDLSSLSIDTDTNEIKHSFGLRPLFKESELESLGINPAELVALRSKIIEAKTMSRLEDAYSETTTFVGGLMKSILENPRYIDKVKTQKQNLPDGLTLDTLFGHLFGRWKQVDKVVKEREGFSGKSSSALKNKDSTPRGGMDFARDVLETEGESAASFDMVPLEPEA
ncbi:MAG: hypothetical protein MJA29_01395, partial [Candidatus Omnitrophica bacterium]|nr:hypothetical protein [Candidatus Omnitrophota bacterium]